MPLRREYLSREVAGWYNRRVVQRFALAVLVGLLTFNVSGVVRLIVNEPCTGLELTTEDDRNCPPTCVTCGCCAQSIEPVPVIVAGPPAPAPPLEVSALPAMPSTDPRDILHVPKTARI